METKQKAQARLKRHRRVRKKILGTPERPRLAVYRSNRHIYAQVIDDVAGTTLCAHSTLVDGKNKGRLDQAKAVGAAIAKKAKDAGIAQVVFDRGGFQYHGRVKAVAEGAREQGLEL